MPTSENYPFVKELILDTNGQISKVTLLISDYEKLIELLEDEALSLAMQETEDEVPLSLEEARSMLKTHES